MKSLNKGKSPLAKLGSRIQYTISSQGAPCAVCGSTDGVDMHHISPVKHIKEKSALKETHPGD